MADIKLLKQLRDSTKAPFKDCKEALEDSWGDFDKAVDILKEKWAMKAAKKAWRETNEWIVKVSNLNWKNVWVKLWCETDFVAKSDEFHKLASDLIELVAENVDSAWNISELSEDLVSSKVNPILEEYIWKIWENIKLLDVFVDSDNCYVYTHPWDKVVAVVYYEWWDFDDAAKELALQIAAMNPTYWKVDDVPSEIVEDLKASFYNELKDSWKPEEVLGNIVNWKLNKYFSEIVLLEQLYIRDDSKKIKDILPEGFEFKWFRRYAI